MRGGWAILGLMVGIAVAAVGTAPPAPARDPGTRVAQAGNRAEVLQLIERARLTVERARTDPSFGTAPDLLRRARGVLIVPELIKGGFFVGGEGGRGVLLARTGDGWSGPAFVTLASASFGLQIGVQSSEVVMFLMTDDAVRAIQRDNFKFGAQASLAVVTVGSNAQAATSTDLAADVYVWAKASGAFAGLTLEGTAIAPDEDRNRAAYGRAVTMGEILSTRVETAAPEVQQLRRALGG